MADLTGGTCSSGDDASCASSANLSGDEFFEPNKESNKRKRSAVSGGDRRNGEEEQRNSDKNIRKASKQLKASPPQQAQQQQSSQPRTTLKIPSTKSSISIKSPASKICEAFFICMDFDGNGSSSNPRDVHRCCRC